YPSGELCAVPTRPATGRRFLSATAWFTREFDRPADDRTGRPAGLRDDVLRRRCSDPVRCRLRGAVCLGTAKQTTAVDTLGLCLLRLARGGCLCAGRSRTSARPLGGRDGPDAGRLSACTACRLALMHRHSSCGARRLI